MCIPIIHYFWYLSKNNSFKPSKQLTSRYILYAQGNHNLNEMRNIHVSYLSFIVFLMGKKSRISYFFDPDIGSYYYGAGHPMKPQRIRAAHELIESYDLYRHLDVRFFPLIKLFIGCRSQKGELS